MGQLCAMLALGDGLSNQLSSAIALHIYFMVSGGYTCILRAMGYEHIARELYILSMLCK